LPPFSAASNREIHADTVTPIASALDSVRAWLNDASKTNIGVWSGRASEHFHCCDARGRAALQHHLITMAKYLQS